MKYLLAITLMFLGSAAVAQEQLFNLPIEGRENDSAPVLQSRKSAEAINVLLIPGGNSGTGEVRDGLPSSRNFLVRSRGDFGAAGFNTYILFRAKSVAPNVMATTHRDDKAHMVEIQSLINHIAASNSGPIWLVGTSMGTVSVASAAIQLSSPRVKGIVLTASIVQRAPGNLESQKLQDIKLPVLMVHHQSDACFACVPSAARELFKNFRGSVKKEFLMVNGGGPAVGDPCQNQHWHGFIGMESEVNSRIAKWIKDNS